MTSGTTVVDRSGVYNVSAGFRKVETDSEVLCLDEGIDQVWARGSRAAGAVLRLAKDREVECVCLLAPSEWLSAVRFPSSVVIAEGKSIELFFVDDPPRSDGEARDRIRLWMAAGRYGSLPLLLDDPQRLLTILDGSGLGEVELEVLVWLARSRGDSGHASFVLTLLSGDDPIAEWFGLRETDPSDWVKRASGFLPSRLPAKVIGRLRDHWRELLIKKGIGAAAAPLSMKLPPKLALCIRSAAQDVYSRLTPAQKTTVENDARLVFGSKWRAPKPTSARFLPLRGDEDLAAMLEWFQSYRSELSWRETGPPARVVAARSFREWFLASDRFPRWCVEGERGPLSFRVNSLIRDAQHSHGAAIVLIVDGLGYAEHLQLVEDIGQRTTTLYVHLDEAVLTVLPTITPVCKGALLSGRPQREWDSDQPNYQFMVRDCVRHDSRGRYLDRWDTEQIAEWLENDPDTSLIVVNHTELDSALHRCRTGADAHARIQSAITYLAESLADLVERVELVVDSLAVLICSDHGQVVGACRAMTPPPGTTKRRVRHPSGDRFPNEVELPNGISLCTEDYLLLDDDSVWSEDGEEVMGAHGGCFPEEVITRVTLFSTTSIDIEVVAAATGAGVAGVQGTVAYTFTNKSRTEVSVARAKLRWGTCEIWLQPLANPVPALCRRNAPEQGVRDWPTEAEAKAATIEVEYFVAGGSSPLVVTGMASLDVALGYESSSFSL